MEVIDDAAEAALVQGSNVAVPSCTQQGEAQRSRDLWVHSLDAVQQAGQLEVGTNILGRHLRSARVHVSFRVPGCRGCSQSHYRPAGWRPGGVAVKVRQTAEMRLGLISTDPRKGTLLGMGTVVDALQIGVLVLIQIALVVALVIVWRDDRNMDGRWL